MPIPAEAPEIHGAGAPLHLCEQNILSKSAEKRIGARTEIIKRGLLKAGDGRIRRERKTRGQIQHGQVLLTAALAVVGEEKEQTVLTERSANGGAKLVG